MSDDNHGVVAVRIKDSEDEWMVLQVVDGAPREPICRVQKIGEDRWRILPIGDDGPSKDVSGTFEFVLRCIGDAHASNARNVNGHSATKAHEVMGGYYFDQMRGMNILAVKTKTLPAFIQALGEMFGAVLAEDIKPDKVSDVIHVFAREVTTRVEMSRKADELLGTLADVLLKRLMPDAPAVPEGETKH